MRRLLGVYRERFETTLDSSPGLCCSQLLDIQTQFQAADIPNSRIGIRHAQRKLELWEELNSRLNETMEENMVGKLKQGSTIRRLTQITSLT